MWYSPVKYNSHIQHVQILPTVRIMTVQKFYSWIFQIFLTLQKDKRFAFTSKSLKLFQNFNEDMCNNNRVDILANIITFTRKLTKLTIFLKLETWTIINNLKWHFDTFEKVLLLVTQIYLTCRFLAVNIFVYLLTLLGYHN